MNATRALSGADGEVGKGLLWMFDDEETAVGEQRGKLIVGNWKMHGGLGANAAWIAEFRAALGATPLGAVAAALCVPAPYLAQCRAMLGDTALAWGAQDLSAHGAGAYTGEVSAAMLADFACQYVIVGHSERRVHHAENDALVAQKARRALEAGLTPIVCVGETWQQRVADQTAAVIGAQLGAVVAAVDSDALQNVVLAYEPVWSIGTGRAATPYMAQEVHAMLRRMLGQQQGAAGERIRILYGGSMNPANASELLAMPDVDGGLIGSAALRAADFVAILRAGAALS